MTTDDTQHVDKYNDDVLYLTKNGLFPVVDKTIIKIDAVAMNRTRVHFIYQIRVVM